CRRPQLLHVHLGLEVRRAEVPVDEARNPLVQPKGQEEVVARDAVGNGHLPLTAYREGGRGTHPRSVPAGISPIPCPRATPDSSPRNGMPWRSTASRLIRSAAVFWAATSRT